MQEGFCWALTNQPTKSKPDWHHRPKLNLRKNRDTTYWEDAKRVIRLIGKGYLLSELNAIWKNELRQYN